MNIMPILWLKKRQQLAADGKRHHTSGLDTTFKVFQASTLNMLNMPRKAADIEVFLTDDGNLLASKGLVVSSPWEVVPSSAFKGRYFFRNTETLENVWSLDPRILTGGGTQQASDHVGRQTFLDKFRASLKSSASRHTAAAAPPSLLKGSTSLPALSSIGSSTTTTTTTTTLSNAASFAALSSDGSSSTTTLSSIDGSSTTLSSSVDSFNTLSSVSSAPTLPNLASIPAPSSSTMKFASAEARVTSSKKSTTLPLSTPQIFVTTGFEVVGGLGIGGYATVVLARHSRQQQQQQQQQRAEEGESSSDLFAMKVVSKKRSRPKDRKRLATELAVLRNLPTSRFLNRLHTCFESASDIFFVCEYLAGRDLYHHLDVRTEKAKWGFEESECKVLLAEVTLGLEHLHDHGFIHRDLKVENIMLTSEGHVKLIDFGIAEKLCGGKEQQMEPTGSLIYMSPELFKHKTGGRHTDWWAYGVLAFELMTGRSPWSTLRDRQRLRYEIENCRVELPSAASHLSTAAHDLVAKLLDKDFRSRLGTTRTSEVKGHAFFREIDWLAVQEGESAPAFACGRIKVDKTESEQALELYLEKGAELASNFSWDEEGLGDSRACATWIFGGVDMVASHPLVVVGGALPAQLPVCEVHAPV